jgi:hypothetical protein
MEVGKTVNQKKIDFADRWKTMTTTERFEWLENADAYFLRNEPLQNTAASNSSPFEFVKEHGATFVSNKEPQ